MNKKIFGRVAKRWSSLLRLPRGGSSGSQHSLANVLRRSGAIGCAAARSQASGVARAVRRKRGRLACD